jgi:hypothetical protein
MEPLYSFQYLDIHSCWPASDADFYRYAHQVRPQGGEPGRLVASMLTDLESILHVCLLTMEPFQGGTDTQLCDTRRTPRVYDCPDRPRLVAAIAQALCLYEWRCRERARSLQQRPAEVQEALNVIARAWKVYRAGHKGRPLTRLTKALLEIAERLMTLTPEEHSRYIQPPPRLSAKMHDPHYWELVRHMYHTFTDPLQGPPRYPLRAVWHTIAVILTRVGLEQDTPEAIAKRLPVELKRTEKRYAPSEKGALPEPSFLERLRLGLGRSKKPRRAR